jgi:hypothetical protein
MRRIEPRIHLPSLSSRKRRCQSKFLRYFPQGFSDPQYEYLERGYKWRAHQRWETSLDPGSMRKLLAAGGYEQIAARAIAIEARTNLLFSFEKMALRDAVKSRGGAQSLAQGIYDFFI